MKRDPLEPLFAPAPAEAATDIGADAWTNGLERRAYVSGWRWGLLCGISAGIALCASALLIGLRTS